MTQPAPDHAPKTKAPFIPPSIVSSGPDEPGPRQSFDAAFFENSEAFADSMLLNIPELAGVIVVPVWGDRRTSPLSGMLRTRPTQANATAGMAVSDTTLSALGRLVAFSTDVHRDLFRQFAYFNEQSRLLTQQINSQLEVLTGLNDMFTEVPEVPGDAEVPTSPPGDPNAESGT